MRLMSELDFKGNFEESQRSRMSSTAEPHGPLTASVSKFNPLLLNFTLSV